MKKNKQTFILFSLIFFILIGCDFDSIDNEYVNDRKISIDEEIRFSDIFHKDDTGVDAFTSATPGVSSEELKVRHAGWQQAECFSCHGYMHGSEKSTGCIVCHGRNGAQPVKPRGSLHSFDKGNCSKCHKYVHLESNFAAPMDCFQCHKFEKKKSENNQDCLKCHKNAHPKSNYSSPDGCMKCHKLENHKFDNGCTSEYEADVVVIGSGGGGLSAAAALARSGKKVVVLEQHHKVGGYMTNFKRGDYTFEVSLHGFDGLDEYGMNRPIFKRLGILDKIKPIKENFIYRFKTLPTGMDLKVPQGLENYKQVLYETFPNEKKALDKFFKDIDRMDKIYQKISKSSLDSNEKQLGALEISTMLYYSNLKLHTYFDKKLKVKDIKLKANLSIIPCFLGTSIDQQSTLLFFIAWIGYHKYGYYYFEGGSQSISNAMKEVILENGGQIHLNTRAEKIEVENGKATMVRANNNVCYKADYVISNASAPATMYKLIGEDKISKYDKNRFKDWQIGFSMLIVYLGVDHDYSELFDGTGEMFVSHGYDIDEGFEVALSCSETEPANYTINNYTVLDPTNVQVEGKNVIVLSRLASYDCFDEWKWGESFESYKELKNRMGRQMVREAEKVLPGLSEYIEYMEVGTPQTMKQFTSNPKGSIFGWDHQLSQVIFNRMNNDKFEGIDNVYLVGAWGSPGGGQSAVMVSGYTAAQKILRKEKGEGFQDSVMSIFVKIIGYFTGIFY